MARVLVISALGTHPPDQGNRFRVHQLADRLTALGHDTHLAYAAHELMGRADVPAMAAAWGDRFHLFDPDPPTPPPTARPLRRALHRVGAGLVRTVKHKVSYQAVRWLEGRSSAITLAAHRVDTTPIDALYDRRLTPFLRTLHRRYQFDAVLVTYVMFTRAFEAFGPDVLKVLDAQDCFSQRTLDFLHTGRPQHCYVPVTRGEEARGLRRADVILAIQDEDRERFERLVRRPVVTVGHPVAVADRHPEPAAPVVLFVGSPYPVNADGVRWFLDHAFPRVRAAVPAAELWLAGGVGRLLPEVLPDGVRRLGFVPALGALYRQAAVVINPVLAGSGLAIKSAEALAAGRPLVATQCGARGLTDAIATAALVATDDPAAFAAEVAGLLADPARRAAVAEKGRAYTAEQNRVIGERLAAVMGRCRATAAG